MAVPDEELARQIKRAREAQGMSQEGLAGRVATILGHEFRQQTIYKIESGTRKVVVSELVAIAATLGVPVTTLLGIGSERAPMFSAGGRLEEAMRALRESGIAYAKAMLAFARTADVMEDLHPSDKEYAEGALLRQTPAWVAASDALVSLESSLKLNRIAELGPHARAVLAVLREDDEHFGNDDG
ncbi:helix-turn-helix domain-containing protein [Microbacterium sp. SD291]|uniref:helix-turn-helix domain-containing protein n=1 Tax=Microbacterium sp. SD291 TaxID=2782007 RepID=UPI001A961DEC|nr:helix-turn-helix transcriptional regulator [Microbacterium sp. SD291]MBO0979906.1 helix-turn-helix transcriptional regulator [Microbacterium sp. SD291]